MYPLWGLSYDSYRSGLVFGGFWALISTRALMTEEKLYNPPKVSLHINCHSTVPIMATWLTNATYER